MLYTPKIIKLAEREPFELTWSNGLLLRSTNWLGDALMTLPAAYQMSRLLPKSCGFFVLCPNFLVPLWEACPWVSCAIGMKEKRISAEEIRNVYSLCVGTAVVFPNSFGSAMDVYHCRIRHRVGRAGRFRSLLLTHRLPEWPRSKGSAGFHQLSYYLDLAASLGKIDYTTDYPSLKTEPELAQKLGMEGDDWLAVAPGAAFGPAKQWPAEHYLAVAKWHVAHGGRVVFVGTKSEMAVTKELSAQLPGSLDLAGRTNLTELMAVLAKARFAEANDSGAMHLAAAVGTRGVAVFGSTDPTATGPIGAPWRLIISPAECRPCFQRTCPRSEKPYFCLREILPEQVIQELEALEV